MSDRSEFVPKSYPDSVLQKDWNKRKCYYFTKFHEFLNKVHDLELRADDVWVVTLPKCGTTWMQELVWLVMNNYDFEAAKNEHLEVRTPFMEYDMMLNGDLSRAFKPLEDLKSPRLIKSHLPLPLLPSQVWTKKPKLVYVFRHPKDAWISNYYHSRSLGFEMDKTLEQYIENFVLETASKMLPFEHATEFYALRNEPWVYYTSFEQMKRDLRGVISDICKFLDKPITEDVMQKMLHHLSFEEMKNNPKTNHHWEFDQARRMRNTEIYDKQNFVRRGKAGGYKDELSVELNDKLDKYIAGEMSKYDVTLNELLLQ